MAFLQTLGIETSCDDTSVAVVSDKGHVFAVTSAHQDLAHQPFGGIVPEIASRNHTLQLLPLLDQCLNRAQLNWTDIDSIAVTNRPGLLGSLLVGVMTAKSLSLAKGLPFIGVHHLEGHLMAPFLRDESHQPPEGFDYPFLALTVSGGHTQLCWVTGVGQYEILGRTRDDAAGEALDKFAKSLGLGFPGGPALDRMAQNGNPQAYSFPRSHFDQTGFDFSFSGLKAAGIRMLEKMSRDEIDLRLADLCASYQEAVVDCLIEKFERAVEAKNARNVVITGGVSANSRLRTRATDWCARHNLCLAVPPLRYCTDNAAMIAYAGNLRLNRGETSDQSLGPLARSPL